MKKPLVLSQRDPRWAGQHIGKSNIIVGRYGCLITCISAISDWFGEYKEPGYLAKHLDFTADGLILWASIGKTLKFHMETRFYGDSPVKIKDGLVNPKKCVVLQVQGYHWVWCLGKIPLTNIYRIMDPWTGKTSTTLAYKRQITGGAILTLN